MQIDAGVRPRRWRAELRSLSAGAPLISWELALTNCPRLHSSRLDGAARTGWRAAVNGWRHGLAPESLRERELAALLCSAALLGANSSPVRDQSGCHAKCTQLWEQKGRGRKWKEPVAADADEPTMLSCVTFVSLARTKCSFCCKH